MVKLFHLFGKECNKTRRLWKVLNFLSFGKREDLYSRCSVYFLFMYSEYKRHLKNCLFARKLTCGKSNQNLNLPVVVSAEFPLSAKLMLTTSV